MSTIKHARADGVVSNGEVTVMVTMTFDEARVSFFLRAPEVIERYHEVPDAALQATLKAIAITQGTPLGPQMFPIDTVKTHDDESAAFIAAARKALEGVALAEWSPA